MKIKKLGNYLEIDGKLYKVVSQTGKEKFEDMEFERVNFKIGKMIKKITEKVKYAVEPGEIIENALYDLDEDSIKKLYEKVSKQKTRPKLKKNYGCFELNVGGIVIPIRN